MYGESILILNDYWTEFITLAGLHLLAVVSPGPDFVITVNQSMKYGIKVGLYTAAGIATGIFLHVTYSLLGIGLFIQQTEWLFMGLRYAAAAYLGYLGVKSMMAKPMKKLEDLKESNEIISFKKAFKKGFFTNALNPKATLFFLTLYITVVSNSTPILLQGVYGIYLAISTFIWFCIVSILFGNAKTRSLFFNISHRVEQVTGLIFIALALKLVLN